MKEFKSKYPKDSKEYLVSYLINTTFNRKVYDTIYKVEDLNIDLEKLSYGQRVIFICDMLGYVSSDTIIIQFKEIIEKFKDEAIFLKHLNRRLLGSDIFARGIDEETDNILQEDGEKININEFLKSI